MKPARPGATEAFGASMKIGRLFCHSALGVSAIRHPCSPNKPNLFLQKNRPWVDLRKAASFPQGDCVVVMCVLGGGVVGDSLFEVWGGLSKLRPLWPTLCNIGKLKFLQANFSIPVLIFAHPLIYAELAFGSLRALNFRTGEASVSAAV